jgi:hypothetical protein
MRNMHIDFLITLLYQQLCLSTCLHSILSLRETLRDAKFLISIQFLCICIQDNEHRLWLRGKLRNLICCLIFRLRICQVTGKADSWTSLHVVSRPFKYLSFACERILASCRFSLFLSPLPPSLSLSLSSLLESRLRAHSRPYQTR